MNDWWSYGGKATLPWVDTKQQETAAADHARYSLVHLMEMLDFARREIKDHQDPKYLLRYLRNLAWGCRSNPPIAEAATAAADFIEHIMENGWRRNIANERRIRNWRGAVDYYLKEAGIGPGNEIPGTLISEMATNVRVGQTTVRNYVYSAGCFLNQPDN